MKHFVLFFRAGRTLSDDEQTRRAEDIKGWVGQQVRAGRHLDPRNLTGEPVFLTPDGVSGLQPDARKDWPLGTMVFFEARDMAEAASIARSHPAPRYGVSIEVREWTSPPGAAPVTFWSDVWDKIAANERKNRE